MATQTPSAIGKRIADLPLVPWPLPNEWVIEGNPEASGGVLSKSEDSRILRGAWRCTPGRFRYHYTYDETLVVVSGRATVSTESGEVVALAAGDIAFFARGQWCTWDVQETVLKGFHADSPDPLPY
jgi:uncharacterized protein